MASIKGASRCGQEGRKVFSQLDFLVTSAKFLLPSSLKTFFPDQPIMDPIAGEASANGSSSARPYVPGIAPIKPEYIIGNIDSRREADDDAAEAHTGPVKRSAPSPTLDEKPRDIDGQPDTTQQSPTQKLKGGARKKAKQAEAAAARAAQRAAKKSGGGQNKNRKLFAGNDEHSICHSFADGKGCDRGDK